MHFNLHSLHYYMSKRSQRSQSRCKRYFDCLHAFTTTNYMCDSQPLETSTVTLAMASQPSMQLLISQYLPFLILHHIKCLLPLSRLVLPETINIFAMGKTGTGTHHLVTTQERPRFVFAILVWHIFIGLWGVLSIACGHEAISLSFPLA